MNDDNTNDGPGRVRAGSKAGDGNAKVDIEWGRRGSALDEWVPGARRWNWNVTNEWEQRLLS
jgi:hypothetical protein